MIKIYLLGKIFDKNNFSENIYSENILGKNIFSENIFGQNILGKNIFFLTLPPSGCPTNNPYLFPAPH